MTREELEELFEKRGCEGEGPDEFLEFERIPAEDKPSRSPDLCAFIRLDKLVPGDRKFKIVSCAEHDQIWLRPDLDELAKVATEDDVVYLLRCGVRIDEDTDSLAMFI